LSKPRATILQQTFPFDRTSCHAPLRSALNQAVKWGLIYSNPCDAVDLPRHRAREMYSFSKEEAARLLAVENNIACCLRFF
jgi:hypothetical protein